MYACGRFTASVFVPGTIKAPPRICYTEKKINKKRLQGRAQAAYFSGRSAEEAPQGCIQTQLLCYRLLALCRSRPPKTSTSMFWFDTSHLTVDGQRNLLLPGSHARDHGAANVFPSVLLPHGLQCQEVLIAKNLQREKKEVRDHWM